MKTKRGPGRDALMSAVITCGLIFTGLSEAGEAQLHTVYPMPVPTPDVIWGPATAPQRGFTDLPHPAGRQKDLVARPGPVRSPRMLYIDTNESALQLRTEPDSAAASRGLYPSGTRMIVLEDQGPWMRVLAPDGRWGWMAAEFLAEAGSGAATK